MPSVFYVLSAMMRTLCFFAQTSPLLAFRQRNKQEVANLKAELQKLQLESKSGAKSKDITQKEIDALK